MDRDKLPEGQADPSGFVETEDYVELNGDEAHLQHSTAQSCMPLHSQPCTAYSILSALESVLHHKPVINACTTHACTR